MRVSEEVYSAIHGQLFMALGLGMYGNLTDYHFHGQVVETAEGDPSSTLYNYKHQLSTTRLMIEMQMNWMLNSSSNFLNGIYPFFNVGIGPTWNTMSGYHEMAFNSTSYPPLPPFQSRTKSNFAYQVGCGLSKAFNFRQTKSDIVPDRIALGYRYANLGHTTFDTRGSPYPYSLNTGSLENNEVYLGYTHLF